MTQVHMTQQQALAERQHRCFLEHEEDEDYHIFFGRCSCGWTGPKNLAEVDCTKAERNRHATLAVQDIFGHEREVGVK